MRWWTTLMLFVLCGSSLASETSLKKLLVLFRHGFRAPDNILYGKFQDCFPDIRPGNLTALGRSQMSYLGYFLRMRYNSFIGSDASQTKMTFSDYPRNVQSARLMFDALFSEYNHSGISFTKIDPAIDGPLSTDHDYFVESFERMLRRADYEDLIKLVNDTGKTNAPVVRLHQLYTTEDDIICQRANDCPLPEWLDKNLQTRLADFNAAYFNSYRRCENEIVVKNNSDLMLQEILKIFDPKNNDPTHKAYLYSSHDINIAALLSRLGLFDGIPVPFGSVVVLELHSSGAEDEVRVLYFNKPDYAASSPPSLAPQGRTGWSYSAFSQLATGQIRCIG